MTAVRPAIGAADAHHEHSVLATLLAEPERIADTRKRLKYAHFVDGRHGDVWAAMVSMDADGLTPTLGDLHAHLPAHDAAWLAGLLDGADPVGFSKRVGLVKKAYAERQVLGKLALADAGSPSEQRQEAIKQTRSAISRVALAPSHREVDWPVATVSKDGAVKPSTKHVENTAALLEAYGITVKYNLMRHRLEVAMPEFESEPEYHENKSLAALSALAESHGLAEKQTFSHLTLLMKPYHPVWDWICSVPWDGQDRMPDFYGTLTASLDQDAGLYSVLIEKWMNACVKAVMPRARGEIFRPPGVLTLQGAQGMGKSRWIESLAPAGSGWILSGAALDPHDKDSVTQLTSVWIVELSELDGTFDRAHIAAIKAFVDRPSDTYRRPYARTDEQVERRTMMAASVNPRAFLADETGSRRWWALSLSGIDPDHGINMQQIWAQVRVRVEAGATWWLTPNEHLQLTVSNYQHTATDPLVDDLWEMFTAGGESDKLSIKAIWKELRDGRVITKVDSIKLGNAMESVRWKGKVNGAAVYRVRLRNPPVSEKTKESWMAAH